MSVFNSPAFRNFGSKGFQQNIISFKYKNSTFDKKEEEEEDNNKATLRVVRF